MSKFVILYRHGIAEEKDISPDDDLRALSSRGRQLVMRSINGFITMLGKNKNIKIYSSPKLRARQTAEILSRELNLDEPEYLDFLATGGNINLIKDLVQEMEPSGVAIFVGHQPYMSVWAQELAGFFLPFKKGTAACFKYPNEISEKKAELRWYLQTRDFVKIKGK